MIKRKKELNRSLMYKIIIVIVLSILVGFVVFIGIKNYKSPMQNKLIGFWNIEFENSSWMRDSIYNFVGIIMEIRKDSIFFPEVYEPSEIDFQGKTMIDEDFDFYVNQENVDKEIKRNERMSQKSKGTWSIIRINPDSVFFNVPNSPLHGKYAIRFFIDEKGYGKSKNNIYKIELINDSTYLICNKGGFILKNTVKDWEK